VLQSLLWADEVREASFSALETSIKISAQEREMSAALVDSMASDFEPDHFTDEYQEQLRQLIEAKLDKGESLDTEETFGAPAEAGEGEVIDLMEALKRSIEKKRGGGAAETQTEASGVAKAAPKAAARTTAAKSTGAKSTGAKSTTTKAASSKSAATKTASSKETAAKTARKGA